MNNYLLAALTLLAAAFGVYVGVAVVDFFISWKLWERNLLSVGACFLGLCWIILAMQLSFYRHLYGYTLATTVCWLIGVCKFAFGMAIIIKLS